MVVNIIAAEHLLTNICRHREYYSWPIGVENGSVAVRVNNLAPTVKEFLMFI